jgi:hypothetical protein
VGLLNRAGGQAMNPVADNLAAIHPLSWADMASWWKEEKVNFPFLDRAENKLLHLFHFENKSHIEIAQQLVGVRGRRWSKDAIRLKHQRIIDKIGSSLSKDGRVVERRRVTPITQKPPDWIERRAVTKAMFREVGDLRYYGFNRRKPDIRGLLCERKEEFIERGGVVQRPEPAPPTAEHDEFTMSGWVEWVKTHPSMEVQESRMGGKPISPAAFGVLVRQKDTWDIREEIAIDEFEKKDNAPDEWEEGFEEFYGEVAKKDDPGDRRNEAAEGDEDDNGSDDESWEGY